MFKNLSGSLCIKKNRRKNADAGFLKVFEPNNQMGKAVNVKHKQAEGKLICKQERARET